MRWLVLFLMLLAVPLMSLSKGHAATATTKYSVTNSGWTDLGVGPMLLHFRGNGVYAVGDAAPAWKGEGFGVRAGRSAPLKTTSHVWAMAASAAGADVYVAPISGAAAPTSVWSATDAAANSMTLTNGGRTVTPVTTTWQSIRGTISRSSGKQYFEVTVNLTTTGQEIGVGLANAGFPSNGYLGSSSYSCGAYFLGTQYGAGFTMNYGFAVSYPQAGDVLGVAIDFTAGMLWISRNNVWLGSGNPAGGITPAGTFSEATVGALFPAMAFGDGGADQAWTIQATAASQKYAPPAGFSSWN